MDADAKAEWIARVLGIAIPPQAFVVRDTTAKASIPRGIAYPKLLLRWRDAQSRVASAVTRLGETILSMPDVRADPRLASAERAVRLLPSLLPQLGDALADLLDTGINAGSDAGIAAEAQAIVARYRSQLAGAASLARLEAFARAHAGELAIVTTLDGCLAEIDAGLAMAETGPVGG